MNAAWAQMLLYANLLSHMALLVGALWCIALPDRRIYPMTRPTGWYYLMWALFGFIFLSNPAFIVLDWNSGSWPSALRFWLALPVAFLGAALVTWGMVTLGAKRTSGLAEELVARGPYLLTRNPQYVGDFFLFVGVRRRAPRGRLRRVAVDLGSPMGSGRTGSARASAPVRPGAAALATPGPRVAAARLNPPPPGPPPPGI